MDIHPWAFLNIHLNFIGDLDLGCGCHAGHRDGHHGAVV